MVTAPASRSIWKWVVIAVVLVVFSAVGTVVTLLTDFLWFREVRLTQVFTTMLWVKIWLGLAAGAIAFVILYGNILLARRAESRPISADTIAEILGPQAAMLMPLLKYLLPIAAVVISFMVGAWASSLWEPFLKFRHSVSFGINDPLFNKDIGFYVFQLPLLRSLFQTSLLLLVVSLIGAAIVYVLGGNVFMDGTKPKMTRAARRHLFALAGLIALSLYGYFQLTMYGLVNGGNAIVTGAGFAQIHYYIPVLKAMKFISLAAALLLFINTAVPKLWYALAGIALLVLGTAGGTLATRFVQRFIVAPNEVDKETPYILWSIHSTRAAYNLDKIEEKQFQPTEDLTAAKLEANRQTTENIRLWDEAPTLTTYGQLQEIRTYYQFLDVDKDRYSIDGRVRQVMLSPRELIPANLPSRIWINEHLTYTHGYGLCLGPVNRVSEEGLPEFFVKNIPPESSTPIKVSRPQLYYGESQGTYAIVNTGNKEFDYPSGEDNVYTSYEGTGGVRMGGLLKKMLFVWRFKELKILLASGITAQSRILYNREILPRVRTAAPFLDYDPDPYMVVTGSGRLVWVIDGYTTTNSYPYSAQVRGVGNYIRNSVKAVVDAYDGSIDFYMSDTTDPIIRVYSAIFPDMFKPLSSMPQDVRSHIRYPQTLFAVQAQVYALYHMTDPQVFYNREDMWKIPDIQSSDQPTAMSPYYTIMKLAGVGQSEEFILMVPFSPAKKQNMIAWLAARCDEPNYGKLLVFNFPKQTLVYGPQQIDSRINQDAEISKQLTLWNQGGSRVIRGSLLVIPIEQSLIFVQPLYIEAQNGGLPELKRVVVAYGNTIVMEQTLEESLNRIFGQASKAPTPAAAGMPQPQQPPEANLHEMIMQAGREFERGQAELAKGNWAGYGAAMTEVKRLIERMGQQTK